MQQNQREMEGETVLLGAYPCIMYLSSSHRLLVASETRRKRRCTRNNICLFFRLTHQGSGNLFCSEILTGLSRASKEKIRSVIHFHHRTRVDSESLAFILELFQQRLRKVPLLIYRMDSPFPRYHRKHSMNHRHSFPEL